MAAIASNVKLFKVQSSMFNVGGNTLNLER
jgi:hypothetical protein